MQSLPSFWGVSLIQQHLHSFFVGNFNIKKTVPLSEYLRALQPLPMCLHGPELQTESQQRPLGCWRSKLQLLCFLPQKIWALPLWVSMLKSGIPRQRNNSKQRRMHITDDNKTKRLNNNNIMSVCCDIINGSSNVNSDLFKYQFKTNNWSEVLGIKQ